MKGTALADCPGRPPRRAPVADLFAGLDERIKVTDAGLPKNHTVVARKSA